MTLKIWQCIVVGHYGFGVCCKFNSNKDGNYRALPQWYCGWGGGGGRGKGNRRKDMASACSPIHRPSVMTSSVMSCYVPATANQRRYFVCYISAQITFPFRHSCWSPSDFATFRCQHWSCTCLRRFFCLVRFKSKALRKCFLVRTELSYPKGSLDPDS